VKPIILDFLLPVVKAHQYCKITSQLDIRYSSIEPECIQIVGQGALHSGTTRLYLDFYIARALAAQKNKENKLSAMANVIFETWNL